MRKSKPSVEDIKELDSKCTEIYGQLHREFANDEKFYELDFRNLLDIPVEFASQGMVLPTARDMPDTFVDHINISNARVFVNKKGTSNISKESAEMLRKFYLGLIHRTNVESDISPWRVGAKHYAVHGLAVIKTIWDADQWLDKPAQREGESDEEYAERLDEWRAESHLSIPIIIKAINPACIMPDPFYGGRLYVIEKHKKLLFDAQKMYPHWKNSSGKGANDEVEYLSYWDKDYRCDLVDGDPVLKVKGGVVEHKYGFIPYTLIESGLGNLSKDAEPEKRYVGILRYITDLLIAESRDFSISDIVLAKTAWPWGYLTGENAKEVTKIKQTFGTYEPLPEGVELHPMTPEVPPDALNAHLYRTSDYIAAHAAPRSVRGLGEVGVRSGADRRLVIAEAAAKYQYSKESFSNGAANVLIKCAMLVKNVIPGDFEIWAKTPTDEFDVVIKKSMMREPFTCYVEFAPISEEDEYRRQDSLVKLWNSGNGLVTREWARKQMSNVDPIAMAREEEKERLRMSPSFNQIKDQYIGARFQEALAQLGLPPGVMPAQAATELPLGSPAEGGVSRGMVPPIPERAPLGSLKNLENQWKAEARGTRTPIQTQGRGGGGAR